MTLQTLVTDITTIAANQLAEMGLTVVPVPSDDPSLEDHSIEFRDARGRAHGVSLQVNSHSASWANTSLSIQHVELKPIEGTRYTGTSFGWEHAELRSNSRAGRIDEIVASIRAHNWFVPIDDLDAGIVNDFRMGTIIPKLREHFFDGEVRLSRSAEGTDVDTIEILDGDTVTAKATFEGPARIRVSYATLAGDERVLEYRSLNAFSEDIDRDLGGKPAPTAASGPRI
ncbi:hypothetical protein O9X98_06000 [Agrobacterium salinitolerans]|nr:hypothetical protein [Agrobacterium salinitolerans]